MIDDTDINVEFPTKTSPEAYLANKIYLLNKVYSGTYKELRRIESEDEKTYLPAFKALSKKSQELELEKLRTELYRLTHLNI